MISFNSISLWSRDKEKPAKSSTILFSIILNIGFIGNEKTDVNSRNLDTSMIATVARTNHFNFKLPATASNMGVYLVISTFLCTGE